MLLRGRAATRSKDSFRFILARLFHHLLLLLLLTNLCTFPAVHTYVYVCKCQTNENTYVIDKSGIE